MLVEPKADEGSWILLEPLKADLMAGDCKLRERAPRRPEGGDPGDKAGEPLATTCMVGILRAATIDEEGSWILLEWLRAGLMSVGCKLRERFTLGRSRAVATGPSSRITLGRSRTAAIGSSRPLSGKARWSSTFRSAASREANFSFVMVMLAMEVLSSAPLAAEPRASEFAEIRPSRAVGMPSSASSHPRAVALPPVDDTFDLADLPEMDAPRARPLEGAGSRLAYGIWPGVKRNRCSTFRPGYSAVPPRPVRWPSSCSPL